MSANLLQNASVSMVKTKPYPYIVIDNALPNDVYEALSDSFPNPENMDRRKAQKNNARFNLLSRWGAAEFDYELAADPWKSFINENESHNFVNQVFDLFSDFLHEENAISSIDLNKFGPHLADKINVDQIITPDQIKPRVTIAVNTPVKEISSVRGAHTDNIKKAFVGLFYLRHEEDNSSGGDLEIFRWKDGVPRQDWAVQVPRDQVEVVDTIEYRPNRYVLFMCTKDALHGVSPRSATPHWRRLVVTSGWLPSVVYDDTDTFDSKFTAIRKRLISLGRKVINVPPSAVD